MTPRAQVVPSDAPFVRFDCVANGNPKPHLSWFFKGERILLDEHISLHNNGSLNIERVKDTDAGSYTCQAENIHGVINVSAVLQITGIFYFPKFT